MDPYRLPRTVVPGRYDVVDASSEEVAHMLSSGLILGWVSGRYEIGPRALGNRSILAAPFDDSTRVRLNSGLAPFGIFTMRRCCAAENLTNLPSS